MKYVTGQRVQVVSGRYKGFEGVIEADAGNDIYYVVFDHKYTAGVHEGNYFAEKELEAR